MRENKTKTLVLTALLAALVTIATVAIRIPTFKGYIHLGDTLVYLSGIILGPLYGPVAAGIGSLFADVFAGFPNWALPSLIIKSLDALVFGIIFKNVFLTKINMKNLIFKFSISVLIGSTIMVIGYFIVGGLFYGFKPSIASIPMNIVQGIGGGIIAFPLVIALRNKNILNE
ncbi:MAG: ECF transporter S component [Bacillota bacterium]